MSEGLSKAIENEIALRADQLQQRQDAINTLAKLKIKEEKFHKVVGRLDGGAILTQCMCEKTYKKYLKSKSL